MSAYCPRMAHRYDPPEDPDPWEGWRGVIELLVISAIITLIISGLDYASTL